METYYNLESLSGGGFGIFDGPEKFVDLGYSYFLVKI
jgi:hypothetical protein